ncbi:MAG: RDD family protein [Sulfurospirillum sp.]|nr:MAG: RDD family protein [Sulfurospirillum sp.]
MRWRDVKQNRVAPKSEKRAVEAKPQYRYAGILDKLKAFITDSFLLSMPIFYIVIYLVMNGREGFAQNMLLGWAYILVPLCVIVVTFYFVSGQTPGLKAYDLKLIDIQTGEKPGILLSLLRFLYFNIIFFTFFGLFVPFFRQDRRGVHDLLSGTAIIKLSS